MSDKYVKLQNVESVLDDAALISDGEHCGYSTEDVQERLKRIPSVETDFTKKHRLCGITPTSIEKYLLSTGWVKDDTFPNPRMWVFKNKLDTEFTLAVPASEKATDFYSCVNRLVGTLAVVNEKSEQEIVDALSESKTGSTMSNIDIVRCSECVHYKKWLFHKKWIRPGEEDAYFCAIFSRPDHHVSFGPDGFCSIGERRENGGEADG